MNRVFCSPLCMARLASDAERSVGGELSDADEVTFSVALGGIVPCA